MKYLISFHVDINALVHNRETRKNKIAFQCSERANKKWLLIFLILLCFALQHDLYENAILLLHALKEGSTPRIMKLARPSCVLSPSTIDNNNLNIKQIQYRRLLVQKCTTHTTLHINISALVCVPY